MPYNLPPLQQFHYALDMLTLLSKYPALAEKLTQTVEFQHLLAVLELQELNKQNLHNKKSSAG